MTTPGAQDADRPLGHEHAFATAQRAFTNGWIDVEDLDRRLAAIAHAPDADAAQAAVADLADVEKRLARRGPAAPRETEDVPAATRRSPAKRAGRIAVDVIFGLVVFATVVNVIVWAAVALGTGGQYFWPVWMFIPLGIVGTGWAVARFLLREDPENPKRLPPPH